ncbi:hypothetical protein Z517_03579 [Fonsecaea pedrosoi CBS 271.37]|uniref:AB hydrolase-1 domain-containing protein n=1 Tax=Fonsecaea pedrosoi CBS 271.37 TaxID=1442368 RepID=A0A0D2HIP0_9EURO|nr:uncharacterized protein Z517_03579 [Fonsecaea pedrosoi CBS 271.37]KIW84329.1 hypothetical protein Z517_03579 [Fonsecaea pedrosoi CBS 271.37]
MIYPVYLFVPLIATLLRGTALAISAPTKTAPSTNSSLNWTSCPSPFPQNFQCAELSAPLHYSQANEQNVTLNVVKIPAKNSSARLGTLVFQEGGPGYPTAAHLISYDNQVGWQRIQERFDVVALDPRGVGVNYPMKCDPQRWNQFASALSYPKTERQWEQTLEFFEDFGSDCKNRTGAEIWSTFDTLTSARDLETLRSALGEGGINYYGLSWGSQRGQQYAQLYPNKIRTLALDSVLDHTSQPENLIVDSAISFGLAADFFYDWAGTNKSSVLYGQDVKTLFLNLAKQLDQTPATLTECVQSGNCYPNVTRQELLSFFSGQLDFTRSFPSLAQAITEMAQGNYSVLAAPIVTEETSSAWSFMIGCNDWSTNETYVDFANRLIAERELTGAPEGGDYVGATAWDLWMLYCPRWPTAVSNPPKPLDIANTSAPVLLVNALWDPETPYSGAVNVQRQIGGSVLLTRHGEGHGSFLVDGGGEAMDIIMDYLLTGALPAPGTVVYS